MTHVTIWTCNACEDVACEITSWEDPKHEPRECPMHRIPAWKEGLS